VKREQRLRDAADFQRVRDQSPRVWPHPLLVLRVAPNNLAYARVGITVSGRVGKAVVRNRVKRRVRAALQTRLSAVAAGNDLLIVARPASAQASWLELGGALDTLLRRAGATVVASASV
jgi:ribonuclease P protein component